MTRLCLASTGSTCWWMVVLVGGRASGISADTSTGWTPFSSPEWATTTPVECRHSFRSDHPFHFFFFLRSTTEGVLVSLGFRKWRAKSRWNQNHCNKWLIFPKTNDTFMNYCIRDHTLRHCRGRPRAPSTRRLDTSLPTYQLKSQPWHHRCVNKVSKIIQVLIQILNKCILLTISVAGWRW